MKLFELIIGDNEFGEEIDEVFKISLVETPAIESNFVFFDKEEMQFARVDDEKRMVMGPILIPNKNILRVDGAGNAYEVFFSRETVAKLAQNYLKQKYTDQANIEHETDVDGVTLVESWVVESAEKDKSKLYGLTVPVGAWMGTFHIENEKVWDEYVKTGKVKGFSIEGLFTHLDKTEQEFGEWADLFDKDINTLSENEAEYVLSKIKTMLEQPTIDSTYPGTPASGSIIAPELLQEEEIEVYGYETTHFYICPGAISTFKHLTEEMDIEGDDLKDMIRAAAVIADGVFMIEKKVIDNQSADEKDLRRAEILVSMFKDIFSTVDERTGMNHDISYMNNHIEVIKSYL